MLQFLEVAFCAESPVSLQALHTEETNKAQNNQWLETLSDAFTGLERLSRESFSSPARRFYYIIHPQRSTQSSTVTKSRLPRKLVVFSLSHSESSCLTLPLVSLHRLKKKKMIDKEGKKKHLRRRV